MKISRLSLSALGVLTFTGDRVYAGDQNERSQSDEF